MTADPVDSDRAKRLLFFVEERSMEFFLRGFLPRFLPHDVVLDVRVFQGKQDLLKNLENRLRGLASYFPPVDHLFVLVDRDQRDCHDLKTQLETTAQSVGLVTRTMAGGQRWQLVNRIVIEELEAWYFGDWDAVRAVYPEVRSNVARRSNYRDPDAIRGGTWEALERLLKSEFPEGLRKSELARNVSKHIDPQRSRSHSFRVFCDAVRDAVPGSGL